MHICRGRFSIIFVLLLTPAVLAQKREVPAPEALMDKMTGHWVMTGRIANKSANHDVDVDWVLNRQYIRIHEVSRDKDATGGIGYEAWIYIVWDAKQNEYAVMWLDNTAATNFAPEGVGRAKPGKDRIPFIWKDATGNEILHNTFAYDRLKDTWSWTIDNVDKSGKSSSFANVLLTRK